MKTKLSFLIICSLLTSLGFAQETVVIPDAVFEQYLIDSGFDTNGKNGTILKSEAEAITKIEYDAENLTDKITDVSGIEAMLNLEQLRLPHNAISSVELSNNIKLTHLYMEFNNLSVLDITSNTLLERIDLEDNSIAEIDVTHLSNLKKLDIMGNGISTLDISNTNVLRFLDVSRNPLTGSLDLSKNSNLYRLRADNTNYELINLRNVSTTDITLLNNPNLTCVEVDDIAYAQANWTNIDDSSVYKITCDTSSSETVAITDSVFEQYLIDSGFDTNGKNGTILKSEAEAITKIVYDAENLTDKITDVSGIEYMVNLEQLRLPYNTISSVDVSKNPKLTHLYLEFNNLTELTIDSNTLLERIDLEDNSISVLDVTKNPRLKKLDVMGNNLTELDLTNNNDLELLDLSRNNLGGNLDLSEKTQLIRLRADNTKLVTINLKNGANSSLSKDYVRLLNNPDLTCISVDDVAYAQANWTNIDDNSVYKITCDTSSTETVAIADSVFEQYLIDSGFDTNGKNGTILKSEAEAITKIVYDAENLTDKITDVSGIEYMVNLEQLRLPYNTISSVDVSKNTKLTHLYLEFNNLTELTIDSNTLLERIDLEDNSISVLDVTKNPRLKKLDVMGNNLTELDLTNNNDLELLDLSRNNLRGNLDLSEKTQLIRLRADNTKLVTINLKNGANSSLSTDYVRLLNNPDLTCVSVDDVAYAQANWTNIADVSVYSNSCAEASVEDVLKNTVEVSPNPTEGKFKIDLRSDIILKNVEVFNLLGRKIFSSGLSTINIKHLPSGVYFIVISTDSGKTTRKLIKK